MHITRWGLEWVQIWPRLVFSNFLRVVNWAKVVETSKRPTNPTLLLSFSRLLLSSLVLLFFLCYLLSFTLVLKSTSSTTVFLFSLSHRLDASSGTRPGSGSCLLVFINLFSSGNDFCRHFKSPHSHRLLSSLSFFSFSSNLFNEELVSLELTTLPMALSEVSALWTSKIKLTISVLFKSKFTNTFR